jgi:RHS repeat-associated protein
VYAGDTNNATSTSTAVSQTVNVKPTTTSLTSGINPSVAGQAVTLTASVSGYLPTGIVTFKDGAAVLGTAAISAGQATFSAAFTSAGAHSLSASYSGDANNVASGSAAVGQAVNQAATSTTLGTSANPSAYGAAINLTATVSGYAPSGTVTFKDGAAVLGTAAISAGQATFSAAFTSAGAHSLSASYSGDANNVASSSAAVAQTVNISATTTTLTATPGTFVAGQAVSLSATISGASPGGTVTFKDGATVLGTGTIAAGKATLNITLSTAGTHSLSASYAGDANNAASNSTALTQSVGVATSSTGLTISANPSTAGQAITLTANITGVLPTGTVTFKDGAAVLGSGSITAGKAILSVSLATVGTHSLSASYAGDANNAASSSAAVSQTVNISPTTTTLTPSPTAGTGQSVTLTASVTGAVPTGTVTFTEGTTTLGTSVLVSGLSTLSVNFGQAGKHSLSASYSGDANNSPSTSITVNQNVSAQVYYIHSDHLDTPRQITDTAGNVVWQRDNTDPYGNNIANENPSGLGKFTCNLGFPGQYFDIESGLFYNRLRDGYDPATGRYTQGDPVGLYGGSWSIFIYAGGNPLSWIDPWGLTHYNAPPPQTVPPTGRVAEQLSCMDRCTGKDLLITGGKEKKGHKGKKHGENKACDIAGPEFNSELDNQKVFSCAVQCGFTNGQYEDFPGVSRDHWHLQDGSGSGVPELPPGSLWDRFKHQINEITLPKE